MPNVPKSKKRYIIAAVLQREDGKILLMHRAASHSTFGGKWAVVTGYIERGEAPEDTVKREVWEELHVLVDIIEPGQPLVIPLEDREMHIRPFLCRPRSLDFRLDWEHQGYTWIDPPEVYQYDTVPGLDQDLIAVGLLAPKPEDK